MIRLKRRGEEVGGEPRSVPCKVYDGRQNHFLTVSISVAKSFDFTFGT